MLIAVRIDQRLTQVHKPAAFGEYRFTGSLKSCNRFPHLSVGGKQTRMKLGIPTADIQPVDIVRELVISHWAERDKVRPSSLKERQVVWIIETKRLIPRDGDTSGF